MTAFRQPGAASAVQARGVEAPIGIRPAVRGNTGGPAFDTAVAPGGYLWWYVDALSDDGRHGLTAIAFVGSVFSPYYARARRDAADGLAEAEAHVALNVTLYHTDGLPRGPTWLPGPGWAMTERGQAALDRQPTRLRIGPSRLDWQQGDLVWRFDERTVPWPGRLDGELRLRPRGLHATPMALDAAGRHRWWPVAPVAEAELDCRHPALRWRGSAYLDSNHGDEPAECAFTGWHWQRSVLADGRCRVHYDTRRRDGSQGLLALDFLPGGGRCPLPSAGDPVALKHSRWGLPRLARDEAAGPMHSRMLEDTPFYARSLLRPQRGDAPLRHTWHESLSLERFRQPWVQWLLPWRMPRRAGSWPM